MTTIKKEFPFKIGADPEFSIILKDNRVPADKLLKLLFEEKEEDDDEIRTGYKIKNAGELGWDGHRETGEIRPNPGYTPKKIVDNMRELFKAFSDKSKLFELSTNSNKAPIGGHIHLELKDNNITDINLRKIHRKMALFYLPIMIGEDLANSKMRIKHGYGTLTDYAKHEADDINSLIEEPCDNKNTYEFRCPNAEWITTPKIAQATLAYMATIYNEIINNKENIEKAKSILLQNDTQVKALQELTLSKYVLFSESIFNKIKKYVRTFEYYESYKEEIEYIFKPNQIMKDKEKAGFEITKGWDIVKSRTPSKKDLLNESKMKKNALENKIDEIQGAIPMPYNPDDTRAIDFAKALKDRIIAYNWKTKYNYFIFGVRKELENYIIIDGNGKIIKGEDIKTIDDKRATMEITEKMYGKYIRSMDGEEEISKEEKDKLIMIGIPYKDRVELNIRKFISIVHEIETNKEEMKKTTEEKMNNLKSDQIGKMQEIYNKERTEKLITRNDRESERRYEDEMRETRREIEEEVTI